MADLIERLNRCADTCEVYSPDQCATLIDGIGHLAMRHLLREAAAALEAAQEDAGIRRFADMLLGGLNDIQDALGFTDEDKLCANGSAEIVAEIRGLREDAERLDWLADQMRITELHDILGSVPLEPCDLRTAIDQARGKGGGE